MAERTTTHDGRRLEAVADEAAPVELSTAPADAAGELGVLSASRRVRARSGAFPDAASQRRYRIVLAVLVVLAAGAALGLLAAELDNTMALMGVTTIAELKAKGKELVDWSGGSQLI